MIKVKASQNMLKMEISTQTDNDNLRANVATNKTYILSRMCLRFRNSKFNILLQKKI